MTVKPPPPKVKLSSTMNNLQREDAGDWVPAPDWPGVKFLVRSLETPSFKVKRDQLVKRLQRKYSGDTPPEEDAREWGTLIHDEVLRGWDGFDVAYSAEVALQSLTDLGARDLRQKVLTCAALLGMVDLEFVVRDAKNSAPPSAGS